MNFTNEFVLRNLVTPSNSSDSKTIETLRFSRHQVSGNTWHEHVDVTWHPRGVKHGISNVVHLCEWLTWSHVSNEEIMGKEKSRKIKENCGDIMWHGGGKLGGGGGGGGGRSFPHFDKID